MDKGSFGGSEDLIRSSVKVIEEEVQQTTKTTAQQILGPTFVPEKQKESETTKLEQPQTKKATSQPTNGGLSTSSQMQQANALAGIKSQDISDEAKLAQTRKLLHDQMYFKPTFEIKPRQIEEERERAYKERNQQEEKKKEMTLMEEKKKEQIIPLALNKKIKSEAQKTGS